MLALNGRGRQFGDRILNTQPMAADRDADVLQHLVIDLAEQVHTDFIGLEGIGILANADRLPPLRISLMPRAAPAAIWPSSSPACRNPR